MLLREGWGAKQVLKSLLWLCHENLNQGHVYIRPAGPHALSLIGELNAGALARMKAEGYAPAAVIETSPEKWSRLFEQFSPIYKWIPGGLSEVQSCPRRRPALAADRPTRWATRGAPRISCYAASSSFDTKSR